MPPPLAATLKNSACPVRVDSTRTRSPFGDHIGLIATGSVGAILPLDSRANSWTQVVGPSARTTTTRVPSAESASSL